MESCESLEFLCLLSRFFDWPWILQFKAWGNLLASNVRSACMCLTTIIISVKVFVLTLTAADTADMKSLFYAVSLFVLKLTTVNRYVITGMYKWFISKLIHCQRQTTCCTFDICKKKVKNNDLNIMINEVLCINLILLFSCHYWKRWNFVYRKHQQIEKSSGKVQ